MKELIEFIFSLFLSEDSYYGPDTHEEPEV